MSQLTLYDPSLQVQPGRICAGNAPSIDLESVGELVSQSEIDFRTLRENVRGALETHSQVSIGGVLEQYPAAQGLGSVVGLIALGSRHGIQADGREAVSWTGGDAVERSAQIPRIYFVRERIDELV